MPKRITCPHCQFPSSVCVCTAVTSMHCAAELIILQHPSEAGHAKNSARLIELCHPRCRIIQGQSPQDFASIATLLSANPQDNWLAYPSEHSQPLEAVAHTATSKPARLILVDATWGKAYKIYQLNPWLQALPSYHFSQPPESRYRIRKTPVPHGLSTLEAAAHALHTLYHTDVAPLYRVFDALQAHWERFAPRR